MNEGEMFIPTTDPNKMFLSKIPASFERRSIYSTWAIPRSCITVKPKLSICWAHSNEKPIDLEWLFSYRYLNQESCLGYFGENGSVVINFDDGISDLHSIVLQTNNHAEKNIVQETLPYEFIKKDRRSGTVVSMKFCPQPDIDNIFFIGTKIQFTEDDLPYEPIGRKRTRKRRWYDDPYPYDS